MYSVRVYVMELSPAVKTVKAMSQVSISHAYDLVRVFTVQ